MFKSNTSLEISPVRFFQFALVGASGLLVNALILGFATERLGLHYLISAALATAGSTTWNFSLSEVWVFRGRRSRAGWFKRFVMFFLLNNAALLIRGPIMWALTSGLGVHYQVSNLISIGAMTVARYLFANQWIWGRLVKGAYRYDIHGIVTIVSESVLPELEPFRTTQPIEHPTMRIRIGLARLGQTPPAGVRRLDYDEGLGPLGFRARIDIGERIEVLASPLLRWSPHVLYTNLVEPILRWTLVEKGYALIHGACLSVDGRAHFITARTDTGKTTTLLQVLSNQIGNPAIAFVADDLTIVNPDGRMWPYPKPLTISAHTVRAINATCLAWHERLFLPLQSRLHSRNGRRFAHWLAHTKLPMATINAYIQCLVPPPKYFVEQLVPGTRVAPEAQLTEMIVIERTDDLDVRVPPDEALEILMRNCADAYGFPPYADIEAFLYQSHTQGDLNAVERAIVAGALRGVPTTLIRRRTGDWWPQVLAHMDEFSNIESNVTSERVIPAAQPAPSVVA
ncbi:MAG TPA: GtrA family protein [Anaerolineales bacterium]|nr:GtrA family protein [Anaerolineales bacterium]